MNSHRTARFRKAFDALPRQAQDQARQAYKQFKRDPFYPSLHFKQEHASKPVYSVHISDDYRALGVRSGQEVVWFWIGGHEEYDRLVDRL